MKTNLSFLILFIVFIIILAPEFTTEDHTVLLNKLNVESFSEAEDELIKNLKVYKINTPLFRNGKENDGGYVVPEIAFIESEALLGYGIADDPSFEIAYSKKYKKPSYGFDCGVQNVVSSTPEFHFISECIGSSKHLYPSQHDSGNTSSFSEQIKKLHLENKKIFIKMDIEGAEYQAFEDIFNHHEQVTGIVLEIHFENKLRTLNALGLLRNLNKNFYLIHIHGNNCVGSEISSGKIKGSMPRVIELTFINKSLVKVEPFELSTFSSPTVIDMPNCPYWNEKKFQINFH